MSVRWAAISDDYALSGDDQIHIAVTFDCAPLSKVTAADIANFLGQQQAVKAVLGVDEGWVDSVTLGLTFSCSYVATVNPQPQVTAGALRSAMYTAISQANATHTIQSNNVLVGTIERASTSIIPDAPSPTTTISLVAVAVVAVVILFIFLKGSSEVGL